ncbi:hypothetical protein NXV73_16755 [Bacteroides salyersiae]|nr:hypothetical protein [Bacteroides salyersiae]
MKRIRVISCLVILLFAYNLPIRSIDKTKNLEVLADSARHLLGKSGFVLGEYRMDAVSTGFK